MVKRVFTVLHDVFYDWKKYVTEFGVGYWISDIVVSRLFKSNVETHSKNVYKYLYKELRPLIKEYQKKDFTLKDPFSQEKINVWACWWQGEENMPELVKVCYQSMKNMLPDICEIHLITWENVNKYIELPTRILDLYKREKITKTCLADVLRLMLLSAYGGFWIDATYYFAKPVPEDIIKRSFFTRKRDCRDSNKTVSAARWAFNYLIGQKEDPFYLFLRDALLGYWDKHELVIDGLLPDYLVLIAYNAFPNVKERILKLPYTDPECHALNACINEAYEGDKWNTIMRDTYSFKLTYKKELTKYTNKGELTFWGYISQI